MTRRELRPGVLLKKQRLITRVQDGTVFFIVVAQARGNYARPLGGGHSNIKTFMDWLRPRKTKARKPRVSERRKRWLAESGQEG